MRFQTVSRQHKGEQSVSTGLMGEHTDLGFTIALLKVGSVRLGEERELVQLT